MGIQSGWMEQRKHERVSATLKVSYRVMGEQEKNSSLSQPVYSQTTAAHLPALSQKFHSYHAVTKDISESGLALSGEHPFAQGDHVEISLLLPPSTHPIKFLAVVARSSSSFQLGRTVYSAGVRILALNKEDMDKYSRFLLAEKLKGQGR